MNERDVQWNANEEESAFIYVCVCRVGESERQRNSREEKADRTARTDSVRIYVREGGRTRGNGKSYREGGGEKRNFERTRQTYR